jgi:tetrahydromethanopterin S-methyltransferase subunit G
MPTKSVSNEDILELLQESMQMTADGFDRLEKRMDNLEGRMGGVEGGISAPEEQMRQVNMRLDSIEKTLKMHDDDIKEILKLLDVLVERVSLTERERELAALTLGNIVDWAQKASKKLGIPLKLKAS